jgi:tetratricopeptide (TPR) repeat protein
MRLILAAALLGVSTLIAAQEPAQPSFEGQAKTLEDEIARAGKIDQKHPDYLAAQLDYAQLLARNTSTGNCDTRLPAADSHFKMARESLVTPLVLKGARGRVPVVGYYLEMARSRCSADPQQTAALQAALQNARDAVAGYRALFMYEPMTIMQFNVAQTLRDLGDEAQAIKELEAAIELDRTFGFKADAEENFRTLNEWQKKELTDADASAFAASFAPRSVTLKFRWQPAKVETTATFDNASYEGGSVRHTKFSMPMSGTIKAEKDNLVYDLKLGSPKLDASNLGSDVEKKLVNLMARILGRMPVAVISKTGELKEVRDVAAFAKQMNAEIDSALKQAVPESDPRYPGVKAATDDELRPLATPENLTARIQQEFSLETGIWSEATMQQNAWVSLPLTLSMNGTPQGYIEHTVEAVFARRLPCGAGKPAEGCVELVLEAVPTPKAVAEVAQKLQDGNQGRLDYAAATRLRLVVDPDTLVPYENETLRYTYLALANKGQRAVKIATEQSDCVYKYRK